MHLSHFRLCFRLIQETMTRVSNHFTGTAAPDCSADDNRASSNALTSLRRGIDNTNQFRYRSDRVHCASCHQGQVELWHKATFMVRVEIREGIRYISIQGTQD